MIEPYKGINKGWNTHEKKFAAIRIVHKYNDDQARNFEIKDLD